MSEIQWVRADVVLAIHRRQLAEHGGDEGIRDEGLLESALNKPINLFNYGDPKPDLSELAASYAYGLANNHPFVDGNKRTAYVVTMLFLKLNGAEVSAPQEDKYDAFMRLASGELSEEAMAIWIKDHIK